MQSKDEQELDALTRMFDSPGWKVFEAELDKMADAANAEAQQQFDGPLSVDGLHLLNFKNGKAKGVQLAKFLVLELQERCEKPDANPEA